MSGVRVSVGASQVPTLTTGVEHTPLRGMSQLLLKTIVCWDALWGHCGTKGPTYRDILPKYKPRKISIPVSSHLINAKHVFVFVVDLN